MTFERHGANINTWLGVLSTLMTLGFLVGTSHQTLSQMAENQRETKESFTRVDARLASLELSGQQNTSDVKNQGAQIGSLQGQLKANSDDDLRQWEIIRDNQSKIAQSLTREAFLEWKADLERRNNSLSAPALQPQ